MSKQNQPFQMFQVEDLKMISKIGEGSFGEVFLTKKDNYEGTLFATKKVPNQIALDEKNRKYFNNEIFILRNLSHENIIQLYEIKRTSSNFYLVFGNCNGGTLNSCLKNYQNKYNRPFSEEECRNLIRQISNGLAYLSRMNIIHRDLKLDNILINFPNDEDKEKVNLLHAQIKIIDFGFARYLNQNELANSILGSPMNMDPQLLGGIVNKNYITYDEKADVWSLATICYNLLIGYPPFTANSYEELYKVVAKGEYSIPLNLKISKQAVSFLVNILQNNPKSRADIKNIIYHDFLCGESLEILNVNNVPSNLVSNGELKLSSLVKDYSFLQDNRNNRHSFNNSNNYINTNNNNYGGYNNGYGNNNNNNQMQQHNTVSNNFDLFNQQISSQNEFYFNGQINNMNNINNMNSGLNMNNNIYNNMMNNNVNINNNMQRGNMINTNNNNINNNNNMFNAPQVNQIGGGIMLNNMTNNNLMNNNNNQINNNLYNMYSNNNINSNSNVNIRDSNPNFSNKNNQIQKVGNNTNINNNINSNNINNINNNTNMNMNKGNNKYFYD